MKIKFILLALCALGYSSEAQPEDWRDSNDWVNENSPIIVKPIKEDNLDEVTCLSLNIYHEARGSTFYDMSSTAHVVLNRVKSSKFPNTICEVVWENRLNSKGKRVAQFSWTLDGRSDRPKEEEAWYMSQFVGYMVWSGFFKDRTAGATHYHTTEINPFWSNWGYDKKVIGSHEYMKVKPRIVLASASN